MQLVKDSVVEGKVTGILKFGAFVDLGEGKSGMVHISEVSNDYVADIKDVLKVGQTVKVRVISVADDGKIALSIRNGGKNNSDRDFKNKNGSKGGKPSGKYQGGMSKDSDRDYAPAKKHQAQKKQPAKKEQINIEDLEYAYEPRSTPTNAGFEDMLSRFKASSEDRMSVLKKNMDIKKKGGRRR